MKDLLKKYLMKFLSIICGNSILNESLNHFKMNKKIEKYKKLKHIWFKVKLEWVWEKEIETLKHMNENEVLNYFNSSSEIEKYVLSKLFYFSRKYNNDICNKVLEFAKTTDNLQFKFWTFADISRFTFHLQSGFYDNYYLDRKELMKQLATEVGITVPNTRKKNKNSLAIITSMLSDSIKNSTQRVAMMAAEGLINDFENITIFPLDVFAIEDMEKSTLCTVLPYNHSSCYENIIRKLFTENVNIIYSHGGNFIEKMQNFLNDLYEFNPSFILDMSDEYSFVSYFYSKDYPTFYLPLRTNASSSFFTYFASLKWQVKIENKRYNSFDSNLSIDWTLPEYVPPQDGAYSRINYGLKKDSFIFVTVGNNSTTCNDEFIDIFVRFLKENKDAVWIFVGQSAPDYLHIKYEKLIENQRIIEWGFENNLYALYKMCNVLLRPNTTGGSGSVAIACMAGLPVVMTNFICDSTRWQGLDYTDNKSYSDLFNELIKLKNDKSYYDERSAYSKYVIESAKNDKSKWHDLSEIMKSREVR